MDRNIFRFKQFEVLQNSSVMKVGTDGVLLGAATDCGNAEIILDIGTGTGLVALMLAQKSKAKVFATDINEDAFKLAKYNVEASPFSDRISVFHSSIQNFKSEKKFDLIVSNPPYFTTNVIAPDKNRALARHNLELTISDLVCNIARLLTENGRAVVIFPVEQSEAFEQFAIENGFSVKSKLIILPRAGMNPVRIITEISKSKTETQVKYIAIEKQERHDYTTEYKELTSDWYLKF